MVRKMEHNKIAILMSTYNGGEYLSKQIESIKEQTNTDWHLYIRDDGSTDDTLSILKKISDNDEKITFVNKDNIKNVGVIRSFMSLLESVDADFYMFSDQDDVWKKNKVQRALSLMQKQDYQAIPVCLHTELQIVDDNLQPVELMKRGRIWSDFQHFLFGNCVTGCTVMINQQLKEMINFNSLNYSRISMHDWLFADVAAAFGKVIYDPTPTILYRQHGSNVVGGKDSQATSQLIRRFFNLRGELEDLIMMVRMAEEFNKQYGDEMSGRNQEYLSAYAKLGEKSSLKYNLHLITKLPPCRSHLRGKLLLDFLMLTHNKELLENYNE